ncbi:uncharacterized protein PgNI_02270 [Pyricularia grisea]|uniref:Uncharacterized protein n=1 Tax=Pyricularia grisea TaxID=148305 RepID=A0A6P8BJY8_PYRGI|nr:uncharacterized protein PgNI_02270 [Pyricularia grisea]TLD17103.1 hypothetical protein PgNI_02270 [Pyricularia grisea]
MRPLLSIREAVGRGLSTLINGILGKPYLSPLSVSSAFSAATLYSTRIKCSTKGRSASLAACASLAGMFRIVSRSPSSFCKQAFASSICIDDGLGDNRSRKKMHLLALVGAETRIPAVADHFTDILAGLKPQVQNFSTRNRWRS